MSPRMRARSRHVLLLHNTADAQTCLCRCRAVTAACACMQVFLATDAKRWGRGPGGPSGSDRPNGEGLRAQLRIGFELLGMQRAVPGAASLQSTDGACPALSKHYQKLAQRKVAPGTSKMVQHRPSIQWDHKNIIYLTVQSESCPGSGCLQSTVLRGANEVHIW